MFQTLDNFRDFGGCPTEDGRQVASGRLFRSGHHAALSDADLETLHGLGLALVADLRRPDERRRYPSRRHPAFAGKVVETELDSSLEDAWIAFLRDAPELSAETFREHVRRFYREGAFEPAHVDVFRRYFEMLAEVDGPVLVHCMAGKDRTGILVALTHALLGVPQAHIRRDYLLTNDPAALPRRAEGLRAFIAEQVGREASTEACIAAMRVEAEYLQLTFEEIERRHGSAEGYLDEVLGVDAPSRRAIRERLLEPA